MLSSICVGSGSRRTSSSSGKQPVFVATGGGRICPTHELWWTRSPATISLQELRTRLPPPAPAYPSRAMSMWCAAAAAATRRAPVSGATQAARQLLRRTLATVTGSHGRVAVEVVEAAGRSELGEGSMWWPERQTLLLVDIMQGKLKLLPTSPPAAGATGAAGTIGDGIRGVAEAAPGTMEVHQIGKPVGTVVLRAPDCTLARDYPLMLGTADGIEEYDPGRRALRTLASPEAHIPGNRANDGKCDPRGRFWLGTMGLGAEGGAGNLWCMGRDGGVERRCAEHSFSICNGAAWSADEKNMYFVDTAAGLYHFDFEPESGMPSNGSLVARVGDPEVAGAFDGTTMDADGHLWIAHWGGGRISQWEVRGSDPARRIRDIEIPGAQQITSLAFGGPALDDLYVTSAFIGLSPGQRAQGENRHAGCLFRITGHGARGLPPNRFGPATLPEAP